MASVIKLLFHQPLPSLTKVSVKVNSTAGRFYKVWFSFSLQLAPQKQSVDWFLISQPKMWGFFSMSIQVLHHLSSYLRLQDFQLCYFSNYRFLYTSCMNTTDQRVKQVGMLSVNDLINITEQLQFFHTAPPTGRAQQRHVQNRRPPTSNTHDNLLTHADV